MIGDRLGYKTHLTFPDASSLSWIINCYVNPYIPPEEGHSAHVCLWPDVCSGDLQAEYDVYKANVLTESRCLK